MHSSEPGTLCLLWINFDLTCGVPLAQTQTVVEARVIIRLVSASVTSLTGTSTYETQPYSDDHVIKATHQPSHYDRSSPYLVGHIGHDASLFLQPRGVTLALILGDSDFELLGLGSCFLE